MVKGLCGWEVVEVKGGVGCRVAGWWRGAPDFELILEHDNGIGQVAHVPVLDLVAILVTLVLLVEDTGRVPHLLCKLHLPRRLQRIGHVSKHDET